VNVTGRITSMLIVSIALYGIIYKNFAATVAANDNIELYRLKLLNEFHDKFRVCFWLLDKSLFIVQVHQGILYLG
jgi:hypothetical protein